MTTLHSGNPSSISSLRHDSQGGSAGSSTTTHKATDDRHREWHHQSALGTLRVLKQTSICAKAYYEEKVRGLDANPGVALECSLAPSSTYSERGVVFDDPLLALTSAGNTVTLHLLDAAGRDLLAFLAGELSELDPGDFRVRTLDDQIQIIIIREWRGSIREEDRSRLPTPMLVLSLLLAAMKEPNEHDLGWYGSIGYDMARRYEPTLPEHLARPSGHRDMVLYFPRRLYLSYPKLDLTLVHEFSFLLDRDISRALKVPQPSPSSAASTTSAPQGNVGVSPAHQSPSSAEVAASLAVPTAPGRPLEADLTHEAARYVNTVESAKRAFARGDLFEVVLSREWSWQQEQLPADMYSRLRETNPAPYSGLLNLGAGEHLIAASPEMFLRVTDGKVESCPIAGTVARGKDALEDAQIAGNLLASDKADAELIMCTDVDRNDKSRVCEPGSVTVRQHRGLEMTSRVMHTVEHIEGRLSSSYSALDAFIAHMWAVTVTGAPKIAAMDFIEEQEATPRAWYAGAFGKFGCDGNLDTAITIRTIRLRDGQAHIRTGSTLLDKSSPEDELAECELKASALLSATKSRPRTTVPAKVPPSAAVTLDSSDARGPVMSNRDRLRVLIVDHEDSFTHTLADYFRRLNCFVEVRRSTRGHGIDEEVLLTTVPELICLSPGPGSPAEFRINEVLNYGSRHGVPVFGVCLGVQAIAEFYGGELRRLARPAHGQRSTITRTNSSQIMRSLPSEFEVGRYHSLEVVAQSLPTSLAVTGRAEDGTVMALEHESGLMAGVQFHPESIMTANDDHGLTLIQNVVDRALLGRK